MPAAIWGETVIPNWKQSGVFPFIAETIETMLAAKPDFVTHDVNIQTLLADSQAKKILEQAHRAEPNRSREWLANNMLAWFSERISVGQSLWADRCERQKIDGYVPQADRSHT